MYRLTREQLLKMAVNVDIIEGIPDDDNQAWDILEKELACHGLEGLEVYQRIQENKGVNLIVVSSQV